VFEYSGGRAAFVEGALEPPPGRWQITEAGRKAIAACPDEYPGDPVYGGD
jgi:hypothetical protein